MAKHTLPPIAQTLSNLKLVEKDDLLEVCRHQKRTPEIIRELFDRKLTTSAALSHEFSTRFGAPLFEISAFDTTFIPMDLIEWNLVEKHFVLPFYQHGKNLFVAMVDPTNKAAMDEIQFNTGLHIVPVQVELDALEKLIADLDSARDTALEDLLDDDDFELLAEDDEDAQEEEFDANDAPFVRYVNKILADAIHRGASDIHVEPFETELRIRFRIDGILHTVTRQPISFASRIVARIKVIARLDIAERRIPQDGRVKMKLSKSKAFDFRVNTLPTVFGEKVVMRILDASAATLDMALLGFSSQQLNLYEKVIQRPYGMVLITGPTGSGKTVTLYSALHKLNLPTKNISTVEDPVEIQLPGITQVNINEKANLGFADSLRAFLRQDPDIIMLGEIRDLETAEIAIKASQTGHMVLSTLHTNDAPSTLTRLLNMGVPAFNVASAVHLIVAQRLVRKLCEDCKQPAAVPEKALLEIGFEQDEIGSLELSQANEGGCENCTDGYRGRTGIFQCLPISEAIKTMIMAGATQDQIEKQALKEGMSDLRTHGRQKVKQGITSLKEIERVTNV